MGVGGGCLTTALGKDEVALLMWMRRVILVLGQYSIIACPNGDRESDRNKLQQLIGFVGWLSLIDSGSHRIATYFTLSCIPISSNSSSSPSPIDFASAHPDTWTDGAPSNINSNTNNEYDEEQNAPPNAHVQKKRKPCVR